MPLLSLSVLTGIIIGIFAGLLPGVHVNNTSAILLGMSPALVTSGMAELYVAVIIIASTISQSFFDIIPAIFLGAPDDATTMAVMPGHRMLLDGKGIEAIRLSAMGSGLAIPISLLLLAPLAYFFMSYYGTLQKNMAAVLILISVFVLLSSKGRGPFPDIRDRLRQVSWASIIFLTSGFLGITAFILEPLISPLVNIGAPTMLLPLLSGLFGAPALMMSLWSSSNIPRQADKMITLQGRDIVKGALIGTASGALVSWFPGVSAGVATTITGIFSGSRDDDSDKKHIVSISGVSTAGAIFSLVALFVIMRPRSGAVVAAQELLGGEINFDTFILFLVIICAAGVTSYLLMLTAGSTFAGLFSRLDYSGLNRTVLVFLTTMCLLMTGTLGLMVFVISTLIGVASHIIDVRKTCLMGVLLVPCILYFL
nr:tripartite tricarboxylate transporter permease [Methanocella sp. CWC-04]